MLRNNNPYVKYIGVCAVESGKRSGKDTFAGYLIDVLNQAGYVAEKRALADSLKSACREIFGLTYEQMHGTAEQKESLTDFDWPSNNKLGRIGKMTAREILQYFGTEAMREGFGIDVWAESVRMYGERRLKEVMPLFNEGLKKPPLYILVPDVRFPNEAEFVDYLVDIFRPSAAENNQDVHASELAGRDITRNFDLNVGNTGVIEDLKESAQYMFEILEKSGVPLQLYSGRYESK